MFNPDMLAAAQKMMANMSPEQMSQIAGMASKMDPNMLKNLTGGNAGLPMPSPAQLEEAKEKMKGMSSDEMKNMFSEASTRMAGQNAYMVNGASVLKQEGNEKVKRGDYSGAIETFQTALENLKECPAPENSVISLVQSLKLNLSLCYLKLGNYDDCVNTCTSILEKEPRSVKALFRRGMARREKGETVEGAIDLKMSLLLSPEDDVVKAELEKSLALVVEVADLERVDSVQVPTASSSEKVLQSATSSSSNLEQAKAVIEQNPAVIEQMGDVFAQMDDAQIDGLLQMSAGGSAGPELGEMKKILKNKDFMKSMTEMMKNMDVNDLQGMMGSKASSPNDLASPDMSSLLSDSSSIKSFEKVVEAMPASMFEDLISTQMGEGKALPSFITGGRVKWVAKKVMWLIRIWIFLKNLFTAILSRNGRIILAILVLIAGVYYQYGHLTKDPSSTEES